ncbi:hypothetical protein BDM02DRAFT_3122857 [Thelephora ganbajun]|uniref:Uncharacterized protein n=1 Tax=Thelephora ganbajun TaxID=370292 RepID=A0ACB6Z2V0_THEGA|nr:hypothetical protein BDM02DRAFT_3122857 [Thelephora ganbajun]
MPKKFVDTSPRRWGTRFDSLVPASPSIPQTELSSPSTATPQLAHQSVRPTTSGYRDLPKLPHDASVFVGSLPSAMDRGELIRALYDHLSPYAEIHNIKVVRDPRHGGVCAFVQCQSAESAAQLITTLHAKPPPPFFGRTLRYERARSLRALLISYRAPTVFTPDPSSGDVPGTGCLKPIEPATAMRLYKTQGAR